MFDALAQNSNYFPATRIQEYAQGSVAAAAEGLQATKQAEVTPQTRAIAGQDGTPRDGRKKDSFDLSQDALQIREFQLRDQEVRAHEAAHAAVGGAFAGSPSFSYERGPDGQTYAVAGEVSIDLSAIAGDPAASLQKAEQIRAAALAPAQPSGQDLKVAQRAQTLAAKARAELASQQSVQRNGAADDSVAATDDLDEAAVRTSPSPTRSTFPESSESGVMTPLSYYA